MQQVVKAVDEQTNKAQKSTYSDDSRALPAGRCRKKLLTDMVTHIAIPYTCS